ncbi:hypothetical protein O1L44_29920 [Streptomyces noursei]|nr:hypothetical protein [Streptomyces noursei]
MVKHGNQKLLLALEVAFVVLAMTGVGMVYLPAALVLGGALGSWPPSARWPGTRPHSGARRRWSGEPVRHVRAAQPGEPGAALTSEAVAEYLGAARGESGMAVTERSSLHMPAVWRSVALISGCPPRCRCTRITRAPGPGHLGAAGQPAPGDDPAGAVAAGVRPPGAVGNGYQQKIRNRAGVIVELHPLMPDRVRVGKVKPDDVLPSGKVFEVTDDWGAVHALTTREILHTPASATTDRPDAPRSGSRPRRSAWRRPPRRPPPASSARATS